MPDDNWSDEETDDPLYARRPTTTIVAAARRPLVSLKEAP